MVTEKQDTISSQEAATEAQPQPLSAEELQARISELQSALTNAQTSMRTWESQAKGHQRENARLRAYTDNLNTLKQELRVAIREDVEALASIMSGEEEEETLPPSRLQRFKSTLKPLTEAKAPSASFNEVNSRIAALLTEAGIDPESSCPPELSDMASQVRSALETGAQELAVNICKTHLDIYKQTRAQQQASTKAEEERKAEAQRAEKARNLQTTKVQSSGGDELRGLTREALDEKLRAPDAAAWFEKNKEAIRIMRNEGRLK